MKASQSSLALCRIVAASLLVMAQAQILGRLLQIVTNPSKFEVSATDLDKGKNWTCQPVQRPGLSVQRNFSKSDGLLANNLQCFLIMLCASGHKTTMPVCKYGV